MCWAPAVTAPTLAGLALPGDRPRELFWRGAVEPDGHGGLVLEDGGHLDLGTWFNAAPVGWWREILGITTIRLVVSGFGDLTIRSATEGAGAVLRRGRLDGTRTYDLPVSADARWYWLELDAATGPANLTSLRWVLPEAEPAAGGSTPPKVTVVVPTYGREQDALAQVGRLLDPAMADVVARVVLVDQARTVRDAPAAGQVIAASGGRLLLREQDNLGGSGGYARGMLESLAYPEDAVLLLDDDARIEPEGLRRMLTLIGCARSRGRQLIVGTPLLSAERPSRVEALAEGVRRRDFRWGPTDRIGDGIDVCVTGPEGWSFADPRAPVDYTGWWGTLLPPGAVAELGLPAPYFLKWDDAEYGLRARRAGYRVACMPGTGAWHPTWAAKGTIASWAAWPLHRNRIATAAAYGAGRGVLVDSLLHQIKHVLSLQYGTADLWDAALAQMLSGPDWLRQDLRATRDRAQAVLDAQPTAHAGATPGVARVRHSDRASAPDVVAASAVPSRSAVAVGALRAVAGLVRRTSARAVTRVTAPEFTWQIGLGRDVVILDGTDRTLVRDPARARRALLRTARLHLLAARRWGALRRAYGRALPTAVTAERWRTIIEQR